MDLLLLTTFADVPVRNLTESFGSFIAYRLQTARSGRLGLYYSIAPKKIQGVFKKLNANLHLKINNNFDIKDFSQDDGEIIPKA